MPVYQLATTATAQHQKLTPIFSFDHANDYVYDVQWSTKHPTVFASVDGVGQLDFWNIAENMEVNTKSRTSPMTCSHILSTARPHPNPFKSPQMAVP